MICKHCYHKIEYGDECACIYEDEVFCSYECMQSYIDYSLPNYESFSKEDWDSVTSLDDLYDTDLACI